MAWSENQSCGGWREREGEWSGNGSEGQGHSGPTSRPGDCGQVEEKQPPPAKAAEEVRPGAGGRRAVVRGLAGRRGGAQRGDSGAWAASGGRHERG